MPKAAPVVVSSAKRADGRLSVVEVTRQQCVMSTGEVLFIRYEALESLAEQVCQEQAEVWIRTWWTKSDGVELIELHRGGEPSMPPATVTRLDGSEVF